MHCTNCLNPLIEANKRIKVNRSAHHSLFRAQLTIWSSVPVDICETKENVPGFLVKFRHRQDLIVQSVFTLFIAFQLLISPHPLLHMPVLRRRVSFTLILAPQRHLSRHHDRHERVSLSERGDARDSTLSSIIDQSRSLRCRLGDSRN